MLLKLSKEDTKYFDELNKKFNIDCLKDFKFNPFYNLIIFIEDKTVLAYLSYQILYDRYEIINFEVVKDKQKQGIGKKMLTALIEEAVSLKMKNISLEVRIDNPALRLYESFGFIIRAKREMYYNGIDGFLMEKELIK